MINRTFHFGQFRTLLEPRKPRHPLVRVAMGPYRLDDLQPGQWRQIG